jgi:hypothetical protein
MASISKRTFLYTDKNYLTLANEEWCRTLPNGNTWSRIRLGMLCAVTPNGTSNITDCALFFGVSSGKTAPSSATNATNFVGASIVGAAAPLSTRALSYAASSNTNPYYSLTIGQVFRRFEQTIVATNFNTQAGILVPVATAGMSVSGGAANAGAQRRRCPIIVDITRQTGGAGLYTIAVYGLTGNSTNQYDFRPDQLLDMVDQTGTPVSYGVTLTGWSTTATTVVASDVEGGLDTICLYWGRQAYPLEVYAIAASVITDMPYPQVTTGGALDTFDSYQVGSVAPAAGTLSLGTGWAGTFTFYGSSNPNFQFGLAGTSSGFPGDDFESYAVGSNAVSLGTISYGTGWAGTATFYGTSLGTRQYGLSGTSSGLFDTFENYSVGTAISGALNQGIGFSGPYVLGGTYPNLAPQAGYAGTSMGTPYDTAGSYALTTGSLVTLNLGLGWASNGTVATFTGTTYYNLTPQSGYSGTSCSFPLDDFDSYAVGAVVSGVTINAGTNWGSYGTIA